MGYLGKIRKFWALKLIKIRLTVADLHVIEIEGSFLYDGLLNRNFLQNHAQIEF